jgi:TPR repeat protein
MPLGTVQFSFSRERRPSARVGIPLGLLIFLSSFSAGIFLPSSAAAETKHWNQRMLRTYVARLKREDIAPLLRRASAGDPDAQFRLGLAYSDRSDLFDLKRSDGYAHGAVWYQKSAEAGNINAEILLAEDYRTGLGVPKNYEKAKEWYGKAAAQGDSDAAYTLGLLYHSGEYFPRDLGQSFDWFHAAALAGHVNAMAFLAEMYDSSSGTKQDLLEAAKWYERAALAGDTISQYNLALYYEKGRGVPKDFKKAAHWLQLSSQTDMYGDSALELANLYGKGLGVEKNEVERRRLLRKASEQGNAKAQLELAGILEQGDGLKRDVVTAYLWYSVASHNESLMAEANEGLARLTPRMTRSEVLRAKLQTDRWLASHRNLGY